MSEREGLTPLERELVEALSRIVAMNDGTPEGLHDWPSVAGEHSFQSGALAQALDNARAALAKAEQKEKGNG